MFPSTHCRSESPTVLIVEDDPDIRGLLAKCLRRRLFDVIEAENGVKALELSRSFSGDIQLLLTDIDIPGIDGATLSRKLISERGGIRVLQMSGGYSAVTLQRDPHLPFLQKPFAINDLFSRIDEVMRTPGSRGGVTSDRQLDLAVIKLRGRTGISRVEVHDGMPGNTRVRVSINGPVPREFSLTAFEVKMMAFYPVTKEELVNGEFPPREGTTAVKPKEEAAA
jgi:DNA-binding NtrC family response regulator